MRTWEPAINPKHRPTLGYLGELRLQQGDLKAAQGVLAKLKQTTFFRSEEYRELQGAIERFQAAGHYVPAPPKPADKEHLGY